MYASGQVDRQNTLFHDPALKLSEQWDRACDYLDDDIDSGYVRVLQELITVSWTDTEVANVVRAGIVPWVDLLGELARKAEQEFGSSGHPGNALWHLDSGNDLEHAFAGAVRLYINAKQTVFLSGSSRATQRPCVLSPAR